MSCGAVCQKSTADALCKVAAHPERVQFGLLQLRTLIAACAFGLTLISLAQAADVDWKMYGIASVEGGSVCFYDANGVTRTPAKYVRVWTKCLLQKDLDSVDIKRDFDGRILEKAARKWVSQYVPPIAIVEDLNSEQAIDVIRYEETVKVSDIQPHARFFYELNCPERMIRNLSTYVRANGKEGFNEKPSNWQHVPPEGTGATLLKILCPTP